MLEIKKKLVEMKTTFDGLIRRRRAKEIFEAIVAENLPKLMTDANHRSRKLRENQTGFSRSTPRHIIFNLQETKDTEKILKETRAGKNTHLTYTGRRIRITTAFSSQTKQKDRGVNCLKCWNERKRPPA